MSSGSELLEHLDRRGLLHDCTGVEALAERLDDGPVTLYCGFDPTADSLHLGNLQSILLLRRFQLAGHAPIALVGGATGMIGDPSGRTEERQFLDSDELDRNRAAIGAQLGRFLDTQDGPESARLVDNRSWTEPVTLLEFLRDVGKYATINTMLARESVRSRMDRESGISFTEFSYMLLQANDFLVLHRRYGCDLQVAGSDQWGNIAAGVDLIRRRDGDVVHGLTAPLIVRADGTKFGKSEGENVWLSADRTSPYRMYQHLLNVPDADVETLLARLTLLDEATYGSVVAAHHRDPGRRTGQRRLAAEVTAMVHGSDVIGPIEAAAGLLFGGPEHAADEQAFELLASEIPFSRLARSEAIGVGPVDLLAATGVARSRSEARRNAVGYHVNGRVLEDRLTDAEPELSESDLRHGRFVLLRRGRKSHHLVEVV